MVGSIEVRTPERRPDDSLLSALRGYRAAVVGDVMERIGAMDGGIRSVWSGGSFVGTIFPVWTRAGDNATLHRALDLVEPGDVMVVNGQGDCSRALFGELMALRAQSRGMVGLVVDGAVRDVEEFRRLGFPVFARAHTPAGPYKDGPGIIGAPVAVGGVVCVAGDIMVADDDGVVVVAAGRVGTVARDARTKEEAEQADRERYRT